MPSHSDGDSGDAGGGSDSDAGNNVVNCSGVVGNGDGDGGDGDGSDTGDQKRR